MFHLSHTLLVGPDLNPLLPSVRGGKALLAVGGGMRVENSDIVVSPFIATPPESIHSNVESSSVLSDCRGTSEGFSCDWLQCGFNTMRVQCFASSCMAALVLP